MKCTRSGKDRTFGLSAKSAADFDHGGVAGEGHRGRGGLSRWLLGAAIALVAMAAGSAQATQYYYVSWNTGDDTTGNGSQGNPWKSISMAILSAPTGTQSNPVVISVAAGTYLENPTFKKNWTTIAGGYDPASWTRNITAYPTIVDGRQLRSVFIVEPSLSNLALDGVTMTNGRTVDGGGLYAQSAITLTGCTIRNCQATGSGGGIYVASGITLTMDNCTVSGNTANGNGGIYNYGGTLTLTNCTVSGNTASGGGGIFNNGGTLTLTNCTVSGNTASSSNYGGGGIYGNCTLTNCTVSGNTTNYYGGGMYGNGTLTNCTVSGNTANQYGGGIFNNGTLTLTNCTVSGNTAGSGGGGIYGNCTLSRCKVVGNISNTGNTGGIRGDTLNLSNCIIWNNPGGGVRVINGTIKHCTIFANPHRTSVEQGVGIRVEGSGAVIANNIIAGSNFGVYEVYPSSDPGALKNNLFFNNPSGHYFDEGLVALNTYLEINILAGAADNKVGQDPLFYDAATGDFHIQSGSPCINAGLNTITDIVDFDGNARPYGSAPDIGAYEYGYPLPPHVPTNPAPANGATGVSISVTLQWQAAARATSYDLYSWRSTEGKPTTPTAAGLTATSWAPPSPLALAATYYWQIVARNAVGSTPGDIWSFQTSDTPPGTPPNTPGNVSPAHGATGVSLTPTLQSSAFSDPDPGDTHAASQWQVRAATSPGDYSVSVYDSGETPINLVSVTIPSGRLGYNTTYAWHVRYKDNRGGWSAWSAETVFSTQQAPATPPNTPSNISPANGATGVSLTPTLQSSAFSDPGPGDTHAASQWQISTANDFSGAPPIIWDTGRTTTSLTSIGVPGGVLTANTGYFWRVRHQDSVGLWSAWSQPTYFQTVASLNATISGRVTNISTTAPIANATVQAFYGAPSPAQTLTGSQGYYSLQVMGDRWCTVTATASGYSGQQQTAYVAVGATVTVNFTLAAQNGTISGRVVRAGTNTGISSATVTLEGGPSVFTDPAGYYTIGNVTAGYDKTLTAVAAGYSPQQITGITVHAGQTTVVNFALVVTGSVTVQGHVSSGTTTLVIAAAEILVTPGSYRTFTNVSGFYSLSIPAGSGYMVRASAVGYSPGAQFPPPLISPNTYTYNFHLTREYLAPAAPTGLTATPGDQHVNLSWNANTESDLAGYNLYRLDYGTSPINAVLITGTSYQDLGLANGTTYTYWVKAVDLDGLNSNPSAQVQAMPYDGPPSPVSGLRATLLPFGIVVLHWNASPSLDAALYHIYSDNGSGTTITYGVDVLGSPVTSPTLIWVSQPLTIGAEYKFGVRVEDTQGNLEQNRSVVIGVTPVDSLSGSAKAYIVSPSPGMTVRGDGVSIYAAAVPGFEAGLAKVRFEVFYNGNWVDMVTHAHGNPDTQEPYFLLWDVTSLPDGPYEIRAVAIDVNSISDGSPMSIQVIVDNVQGEAAGAGSLIDAQEGSTADPLRLREKRQLAHRNSPTQIVIGSAVKDQLTSVTIPVLALDRDTKVRVTLLDERRFRELHELKVQAGLTTYAIYCAIDEFTEVVIESGQTVFAVPVKMTLPYADVDNDGWIDGYAIHESRLTPVLIDQSGRITELAFTPDTLKNHFVVALPKAGTIGLILPMADINVAIPSAVPTPRPEWIRTGIILGTGQSTEIGPLPAVVQRAVLLQRESSTKQPLWAQILSTWGTITWNGQQGQPFNPPLATGPEGTGNPANADFFLPGYSEFGLYLRIGRDGPPILARPGAILRGDGEIYITTNTFKQNSLGQTGEYVYAIILRRESMPTRAHPAWLKVR